MAHTKPYCLNKEGTKSFVAFFEVEGVLATRSSTWYSVARVRQQHQRKH